VAAELTARAERKFDGFTVLLRRLFAVCRQLVGFAGSFARALDVTGGPSCVAAAISLMASSDHVVSLRCRLKPSCCGWPVGWLPLGLAFDCSALFESRGAACFAGRACWLNSAIFDLAHDALLRGVTC